MKFRDMFNRSDLTAAITGITSTITWLADGTGKAILLVFSIAIGWYTIREKRLAVKKYELEIEQLTSDKEA